jgi:hypothetical protein
VRFTGTWLEPFLKRAPPKMFCCEFSMLFQVLESFNTLKSLGMCSFTRKNVGMARVRKMYSFSFPGQRVIYLFHFKHPKGF